LKKYRQLTIGLIIAAGALYFTLQGIALKDLVRSLRSVEYIFLLPATGLIAFSYVVHAVRWRLLLLPLKQVEVSGLYAPMMVGNMGNLLPARAGEVVRAYLFSRKYDVPITSCIATILVLRLFDLTFLLLLVIWVFGFYGASFDSLEIIAGVTLGDVAAQFVYFSAGLLAVLLVFTYFLVRHKSGTLERVGRWISPLPKKWQEKVVFLIEEFLIGFIALKNITVFLKVSALSVFELAVNVVSLYPLYWAYNLQDKTVASLLILMVVLSVVLIVLPAPAFLGSFNMGVMLALHQISGESELAAASFGFVAWGLNFLVIILSGIYFILRDHLSVRKLIEVEEAGAGDP